MLNDRRVIIRRESMVSAILVHENIQPAMLLNLAGFNRPFSIRSNVDTLLQEIQTALPSIIFSKSYIGTYEGILMAKRSFDGICINVPDILGELHTCETNIEDDNKYTSLHKIRIRVTFDNNFDHYDIVETTSNDFLKINMYENFAQNAQRVLQKPIYTGLLHANVVKVRVETETIPTIKLIVAKLSNMKLPINEHPTVTNADYTRISEIAFETFGEYGSVAKTYIKERAEFNNSTHRGFLIGMLINHLHYTVAPLLHLEQDATRAKALFNISTLRGEWMVWLLNAMAQNRADTLSRPSLLKGRTAVLLAIASSIANGHVVTREIADNVAISLTVQYGHNMREFLNPANPFRGFHAILGEHIGLIVFCLMDAALEQLSPYRPLSRNPVIRSAVYKILKERTTDMLFFADHCVPKTMRTPAKIPVSRNTLRQINRAVMVKKPVRNTVTKSCIIS